MPGIPLADGVADLVYTGKGALIWMRDLDAWAREAARLLRPGGHLFVYEGHPAVPLWAWDEDEPRNPAGPQLFAGTTSTTPSPARGAIEWQWTLGQVVTAVITGGAELLSPCRVPGPFWRPGGVRAAAWDGRLPNTYSLLARRPAAEAAGSRRARPARPLPVPVQVRWLSRPGSLRSAREDVHLSRGTPSAGKSTVAAILQRGARTPLFEFGRIPEFRNRSQAVDLARLLR